MILNFRGSQQERFIPHYIVCWLWLWFCFLSSSVQDPCWGEPYLRHHHSHGKERRENGRNMQWLQWALEISAHKLYTAVRLTLYRPKKWLGQTWQWSRMDNLIDRGPTDFENTRYYCHVNHLRVGTIIITILQFRKLRHKDIKQLLQAHTASQWQSQNLKSWQYMLLTTTPC